MTFSPDEQRACERLARLALDEDLGTAGDLTSSAVIPEGVSGSAVFVARTAGFVAGLPAARIVFAMVDASVTFEELVVDGTILSPMTRLAVVRGPMRSILAGERTALNFMQRLSGIASQTAAYVREVAETKAKILDTRKTTPGWRLLEKYAVRMGGGSNHRMGLYDGVLIKDNHLAAMGVNTDVVATAVKAARARHGDAVPLEIEVDTLDQLAVALAERPDIVLLDNMSPDVMGRAVALRDRVAPGVQLEASGGITLQTLRAAADAGVERISVGSLTHSVKALDIGLDYGR